MWSKRRHVLHMLVSLTGVLLTAGCGTTRTYVGTSDEVWAAVDSAIWTEYRKRLTFPGVADAGTGEFFICTVRTRDSADRARGKLTLCGPGGGPLWMSISATEISITPVDASTAVPHRVTVRVWYRSWLPWDDKVSSPKDEADVFAAIERAWARRKATTQPVTVIEEEGRKASPQGAGPKSPSTADAGSTFTPEVPERSSYGPL